MSFGTPAFLCDPIGFRLQFSPVRTAIGGLGALFQLDPDTGQAVRQSDQVVEIDRLAVELAAFMASHSDRRSRHDRLGLDRLPTGSAEIAGEGYG